MNENEDSFLEGEVSLTNIGCIVYVRAK